MSFCPRPRRRTPLSGHDGFSLIELMSALAIGGLLAMTSIPVITGALEASRARGAADDIASLLTLARFYAVSNFATYTVTITHGTPPAIGIACTAGCPPAPPTEPVTLLPHYVTTSGANSVVFDSLGNSAAIRTVTVSYSGTPNWQVQANTVGRIRTCKNACS